jgi:NitT/TauT family transport system substrate-binding protein
MRDNVGRLSLVLAGLLVLGSCGRQSTAVAPPVSATPKSSGPIGSSAQTPQVEPTPLTPPVTVRIGVNQTLAESGQYIADERGYFREEGLQVEFTPFDGAARMTSALASGQLDVGAGGVSAGLFNAIGRGVPIRIVGPQARHERGANALYVMVRQDLLDNGQVREYADLRGRKLAVLALGSAPEYGGELALRRGGLQPTDVEWVELPFADMVPAFASGAIDAAVQSEPAASLAVSRGVAVKWREMAEVQPGIQFTVVLYSPAFAMSQEAGRRWMVAYLRGVRDYTEAFKKNRGRNDVVAILTRHTLVKDAALYDQMGFADIDPNGRVSEASLLEQVTWLADKGLLHEPVDLRQVIDPSFADYAVDRLGRYE